MTYRDKVQLAVVIVVSVLIGAVLNALYTNSVDTRSNRNWCDLIVSLDNRNQTANLTTPEQKEFARLIAELRERQGCQS